MQRWGVILRNVIEALGILVLSVLIFWALVIAYAFVVWTFLRLIQLI